MPPPRTSKTIAPRRRRRLHYTAKPAGEEYEQVPTTDDYFAALDHLIDASCE